METILKYFKIYKKKNYTLRKENRKRKEKRERGKKERSMVRTVFEKWPELTRAP